MNHISRRINFKRFSSPLETRAGKEFEMVYVEVFPVCVCCWLSISRETACYTRENIFSSPNRSIVAKCKNSFEISLRRRKHCLRKNLLKENCFSISLFSSYSMEFSNLLFHVSDEFYGTRDA